MEKGDLHWPYIHSFTLRAWLYLLKCEQLWNQNKTLVDIKYKWENMAAASILTLLLTKSHSRRDISVDEMSEMFPTLFSSCKWYGVRCSDHLKLVPYIQVCLICVIFVVMFSVRLAGWPEGWQSVVCGKNFNVVIFSDTVNMTYVKRK